ncbi:hypothetical protein [Paraglaciecola sp. L3A3]|uniref:hypothetical protein n=1 Tax=Paraglaciecola sp. L3A3 TaxID=2686358 RepID=UPI00131E9C75|nr:hypothetical protein [Paraglaciecola sp. L3A3]
MSDKTTSQFIREYKRASKSPWNDSSTILLLANVKTSDNDEMELSFEQYIYLHRDSAGRSLGVSISQSLLNSHTEFDSKYLADIDMIALLLIHIDDIRSFCELFADEFEDVFLIEPSSYFEVAESQWLNKLENI